jgi:hypothetical protein
LGMYRAGLGLGTELGYMGREQFTSFWGPQADPYLVAVRGVKSLGDDVLHCGSYAREYVPERSWHTNKYSSQQYVNSTYI